MRILYKYRFLKTIFMLENALCNTPSFTVLRITTADTLHLSDIA